MKTLLDPKPQLNLQVQGKVAARQLQLCQVTVKSTDCLATKTDSTSHLVQPLVQSYFSYISQRVQFDYLLQLRSNMQAEVVALLVEQLLPTPEIRNSNRDISNFFLQIVQ